MTSALAGSCSRAASKLALSSPLRTHVALSSSAACSSLGNACSPTSAPGSAAPAHAPPARPRRPQPRWRGGAGRWHPGLRPPRQLQGSQGAAGGSGEGPFKGPTSSLDLGCESSSAIYVQSAWRLPRFWNLCGGEPVAAPAEIPDPTLCRSRSSAPPSLRRPATSDMAAAPSSPSSRSSRSSARLGTSGRLRPPAAGRVGP